MRTGFGRPDLRNAAALLLPNSGDCRVSGPRRFGRPESAMLLGDQFADLGYQFARHAHDGF